MKQQLKPSKFLCKNCGGVLLYQVTNGIYEFYCRICHQPKLIGKMSGKIKYKLVTGEL